MVVLYQLPRHWIRYDPVAVAHELVEAKAAVIALTTTPFQREWVQKLQQIQLKTEVAGTSRIEGAEFTDDELQAAIDPSRSYQELLTRSQRQARSAVQTYRWIAELPPDRPINAELVREVHRRIVTGCDDDHCPPGVLRGQDQNVTFGAPRHRGCEGGSACERAFSEFMHAVQTQFKPHDPLIQALALHYHMGAMHPFLDGNGRTARAVEALMLRRAGLRDTAFIAMSNYYYEEKPGYLNALAETRARDHDLTPFLKFGLKGVALQCQRLFGEIRKNMAKALFRNTMYDLFNRLVSPKKRALKERQIQILNRMLEVERIDLRALIDNIQQIYRNLKAPRKALIADLNRLIHLGALQVQEVDQDQWIVEIRLEWPEQITESEFFARARQAPKGVSFKFLR